MNNIWKYVLMIPAIAAVISSAYVGLSYIHTLQSTVELNEKHITELRQALHVTEKDTNVQNEKLDSRVQSAIEKLQIRLAGVENLYKDGSERMLIEMTNIASEIAEVRVRGQALQDNQHMLASEAEFRSLEQSYYQLKDAYYQQQNAIQQLRQKIDFGGY